MFRYKCNSIKTKLREFKVVCGRSRSESFYAFGGRKTPRSGCLLPTQILCASTIHTVIYRREFILTHKMLVGQWVPFANLHFLRKFECMPVNDSVIAQQRCSALPLMLEVRNSDLKQIVNVAVLPKI